MPQLVWKDVVVAEPVDAGSLTNAEDLPPPSSQLSSMLASYPPPPPSHPDYRPSRSSMAEFLDEQPTGDLPQSGLAINSAGSTAPSSIVPASTASSNSSHSTSLAAAGSLSILSTNARTTLSLTERNSVSAIAQLNHSSAATSLTPASSTAASESTPNSTGFISDDRRGTSSAADADPLLKVPERSSDVSSNLIATPLPMLTSATHDPQAPSESLANGIPAPLPANSNNTSVDPSAHSAAELPSTSSNQGLEDSSASVMVKKKKRSEMGPAERQLARQASASRAQSLSTAIGTLLEEQEALVAKTADEHNVSAARIKRLANQAPGLKPKKNANRPSGSKLSSKLIHEAVKEDEDLQDVRNDEAAMAELRKRYMEDKGDEDVAVVRVSKRREAKTAASQVSAFQKSVWSLLLFRPHAHGIAQSDYLYESLDITSFGMVVRSSLDSTVMASYFGRGPIDEFLRSEYGVGIQTFTQHFETWVLARNTKLHKKISVTDMAKDLTRLISRGLSEITGVKDITMNYASFEANICIPYRVAIENWPSTVPWSYPQKLAADEVRTLYESWNNGKTRWYRLTAADHRALTRRLKKEGRLNPKEKKRRKAGASSTKTAEGSDNSDSTSESESSTDGDASRPTKKSKRATTSSTTRKARAPPKAKSQKPSSSSRAKLLGKKKATEKQPKKKSSKKKSVRFIVGDDEDESVDSSGDDESEADFSGNDE
ncbi:hypothetical protein FB446DRAFT_795260 [Lentinula raphanica]|nr:hypothetical protein FB446DRAFT_795260 [Lentinula raphanica]